MKSAPSIQRRTRQEPSTHQILLDSPRALEMSVYVVRAL